MRARLVDACRVRREYLKITLEPQMRWPDGVAAYKDRWQRLDAVLAEFQRKPTNFDSRAGLGLAERIHRVEPTKMLEGTGRAFFTLRPDGYAAGSYGPYELAKTLEEAYKRKGFDDGPVIRVDGTWGEEYGRTEPDLICSELNDFFNALSQDLRQRESDQALKLMRRRLPEDEEMNKKEDDKRKEIINRATAQDQNLQEVFARKCCSYCFRLIPDRSGVTNSTTGKTCSLHDPKKNKSLYDAALKRNTAQEEKLAEQRKNKAIDTVGNANDPELVPHKLRLLMEFTLMNMEAAHIHDNGVSDFTAALFSSDIKRPVDTDLLNSLLDEVLRVYPPIARPEQFVTRIRSLIDKSQHTPPRLLPEFGWFLFDEHPPFYPTIIATYMRLFLEESWFAEEHDRNYYGSERGRGRPRKKDHQDLINSALSLQENESIKKAQAIKILAEKFDYTTTRVGQILTKNKIVWKKI
jgi:hypothetical protein